MAKLLTASRLPLAALGFAAAGITAMSLASTDALIDRSVSAGLGAAQRTDRALPVAGSEAFWLSRHEVAADADLGANLLGKPVALGDRVTIASSRGDARVLEVVALSPLDQTLVRTSGDATAPSLVLVTCRELVTGSSRHAHTVRFIVESEQVSGTLPKPAPEKVL